MPERHGGTDCLKYGPTPEAGADQFRLFYLDDRGSSH
jgi:hypothetical protein